MIPKRIFVSSRLPFSINSKSGSVERGAGGLVSALMSVSLDEPFSWLGFETSERNAKLIRENAKKIKPNLDCYPVLLPKAHYEQYYDGFANDVLWPLFHYEGHLASFNRENWKAYCDANQIMADAILEIAKPGDTVWIHDFHFFLLPQFLREKNKDLKIGFFLHIPFPAAEIFRQLPVREQILKSLIQCDLVGFHEHSYLRQFVVSLKAHLGMDSSLFKVQVDDHVAQLGVYPISIDTDEVRRKANSEEVCEQSETYRQMSHAPFLVLGVDRLDYSKGIELKLRGFQQALRTYPELIGKVSLLQVAVPTRQKVPAYMKMKKEVDQLVGAINGEFGGPDYVPVQYIFNSVDEKTLLALYRRANATLITSKRDGMNLVAMEYVVAQDVENAGVLILSEFAGASSLLGDALSINPWDRDDIADAIFKAYNMPYEERRERLYNSQEILSRYSSTKWAMGFLNDLDSTVRPGQHSTVLRLPAKSAHWPGNLPERIRRASKIRMVLDYDGTLVAIAKKPDQAILLQETKELLFELGQLMEIYILSGRSKKFLDGQFESTPFFIGAEHGAFYKYPGEEWQSRVSSDIHAWYPEAHRIMQAYAERVPLSFVEKKEAAVVWHYRSSPPDFAEFQAKKLDDELQAGLANEPVVMEVGKKIIEAKAIECNKGNFLRWLMQSSPSSAFYICIGDDKTDEEMFKVIDGHNCSIKIGTGFTHAQYRINTQAEILAFFKELRQLLMEDVSRIEMNI